MSGRKKAVLVVCAVVGILLLAAVFLGYSFLYAGLPDYGAEIALEGLQGEVIVNRNSRGVAYIEAETERDKYFVQGYMHAQDRFWQMELQRRVVQGRLSEVFGADQLSTDQYLKKVGLDDLAKRMLDNTSPEGVEIFENYARGVNAYLENNSRSLEFRLLGFEPELWTAQDSAGIISLMAFDLGGNWREEILRQAMSEELDAESLDEIMPPYEDWDTPLVLGSGQSGQDGAGYDLIGLLEETSLGHLYSVPRLGSNSWVISPELSATGNAVMANDPHLTLGLPSIWYENALSLKGEPKQKVYGWSIPGSPGVIIGNNRYIAWGMTNIGDSQDLFLEERHPDDPHRFKYEDQWYEAEVVEKEIQVEGQDEPDVIEVIHTRHGPLISDDPPLSMRWTAYEAETSTADAIFKMNQAAGWEEFKAALKHFSVPVQAIVYADVKGNIGFRVAGDLPVRKEGQGLIPSPGWEEGSGWEKMVPFDELPELYNPDQGYIVTANHRVEPEHYPYQISLDSAPHYRKQRITEFLGSAERVSIEDSKMLQNDWYNRHAEERLPNFVEIVKEHKPELSAVEKSSLELLKEWADNPVNEKDSAAAPLFQVWYLNLMEEVFRDKLGDDLYLEFIRHDYVAYNSLEYLLELEESAWLPDGPAEVLINSYVRSVEELIEKQGDNPELWRWEELQTIAFNHDLGVAPIIGDYLFNRGPFPYGGDHMTVGRARYALDDPFNVIGGAGLRFIADMDEPILSNAVIAGGQSGHPFSPHYSDQLETWLDGEYYEVVLPRDPDKTWENSALLKPAASK